MKKQICTPTVIGDCPVIIAEAMDGEKHLQVVVEVDNGQWAEACESAFRLLGNTMGAESPKSQPSSGFEPEPMSAGKKVPVNPGSSQTEESAGPKSQKVDPSLVLVLKDTCTAERIEFKEPSSNEEAIKWIRQIREEGVRVIGVGSC